MALGPEQALVNQQYVQLLKRVSYFTSGGNVSIPISAVSYRATSASINVPIPSGQAIRIVSVVGQILDHAGNPPSGKLTLTAASLIGLIQQGAVSNAVFSQPWPTTGFILPYFASWNSYKSDELILFNDYSEFGGIPPGVSFSIEAALSNSDGAATHAVDFALTVLVEFFILKPAGHVGYP